jgi:hypothetical protein
MKSLLLRDLEAREKAAVHYWCDKEWIDRSRYDVLIGAARDEGREPTKLEQLIWGDVLELREALRAETRESNKRLWPNSSTRGHLKVCALKHANSDKIRTRDQATRLPTQVPIYGWACPELGDQEAYHERNRRSRF